ncbi:MAG: flippase-like domain-containing protein [Proteobacteria bacterium]|nr:flippase-like domain-containing protein [Pseudomonadota bacterium]MCP4918800.1 flippase-like domain-containing protein [Pseudomonadota bacterium]
MIKKVLIGVVVGVALLALAFWGVPVDDVRGALAQMNPLWLIPVALIFLYQQAIRAWRQQIMVKALVPTTTYWTNLGILCMGFLCINTFPARLGEVVRPYLLMRKEGLPMGAGFGLTFVERLLDLTATLVILALVMTFADLPSHTIELAGRAWDVTDLGTTVGTTLLLPLLVIVLSLLFFGQWVLKTSKAIHVFITARISWGWLDRLGLAALKFAESFVQGLESVRSPTRLAALVALTAATWAGSAFLYTALAAAFGFADAIQYLEGLGVMVLIMLGTMAPAPPGFVGVYEAAGRGALAVFGVHGGDLDSKALAYTLVLHYWTYFVQALTAWWFFRRESEGWWELMLWAVGRRKKDPAPDAAAGSVDVEGEQ